MGPDQADISNVFDTVSLGSPQNAIGFVLWRVFHRYQREVDRALEPLGMTLLQFTTLTLVAWFGKSGKEATQADLARFGDMHPMQLSLMLKALEKKMLIARSISSADVRAKRAVLTGAGLIALREALPVVVMEQQRIFGEMGAPGGILLSLLATIDQADTTHPQVKPASSD